MATGYELKFTARLDDSQVRSKLQSLGRQIPFSAGGAGGAGWKAGGGASGNVERAAWQVNMSAVVRGLQVFGNELTRVANTLGDAQLADTFSSLTSTVSGVARAFQAFGPGGAVVFGALEVFSRMAQAASSYYDLQKTVSKAMDVVNAKTPTLEEAREEVAYRERVYKASLAEARGAPEQDWWEDVTEGGTKYQMLQDQLVEDTGKLLKARQVLAALEEDAARVEAARMAEEERAARIAHEEQRRYEESNRNQQRWLYNRDLMEYILGADTGMEEQRDKLNRMLTEYQGMRNEAIYRIRSGSAYDEEGRTWQSLVEEYDSIISAIEGRLNEEREPVDISALIDNLLRQGPLSSLASIGGSVAGEDPVNSIEKTVEEIGRIQRSLQQTVGSIAVATGAASTAA